MQVRTAGALCVALFLCGQRAVAQAAVDSTVTEGDYGLVRTNIKVACDHACSSLSDGFTARVSYLCFRTKTFTLTATGRYASVTADFGADEMPAGRDAAGMGLNGVHVAGQVGISLMARTRLWGRPLVAFANVGAEFGQGGYGRTSAMAMAMVMLCHTARTQFGLGPMVLVNTNSKVPAFLVFMYRHRFSERWAINLYGGMFGIDYTPTRDDLIAIGGDIDVKSFFLCPQREGLPGRCVYRKTAFRPMVKYRRRLRTHLYVEAMAGVSLSMSSRVTGLTGTTEYMDISQKPAPFAQIGVSYAL